MTLLAFNWISVFALWIAVLITAGISVLLAKLSESNHPGYCYALCIILVILFSLGIGFGGK